MAAKDNPLIIIGAIIVGVLMVIGFGNIYDKIIKDSITSVITLFTIPAIIGALIINSEYKSNGEGFLFSTILFFGGLLLKYASTESWVQTTSQIALLAGIIVFVFNLLSLFYKLFKSQQK